MRYGQALRSFLLFVSVALCGTGGAAPAPQAKTAATPAPGNSTQARDRITTLPRYALPGSAKQASLDAAGQIDPTKFGSIDVDSLPVESGKPVVMRVNGIPLTLDDYMTQLHLAGTAVVMHHQDQEESIAAAFIPVLEEPLIQLGLFRDFASRHSIFIQPREVDSNIQSVLSIRNPLIRAGIQKLSPEQVRQYATDNLTREKVEKYIGDRATSTPATLAEISEFITEMQPTTSTTRLVRARHIVIRATPDMSEFNINDAHAKAEDVLKRIRDGLDFATAARQFSQDRFTTYLGGDIGYFKPGSMYEEFEKAAFNLEPGEVSDVVRTPVGFHIIQVTESHNDDLLLMLDSHRRAHAVGQWKATARENANLEFYLKAK